MWKHREHPAHKVLPLYWLRIKIMSFISSQCNQSSPEQIPRPRIFPSLGPIKMCSSCFERKKKIKPPKGDKESYTLAELRQGFRVAYQRVEGNLGAVRWKAHLNFEFQDWVLSPERTASFFLAPKRLLQFSSNDSRPHTAVSSQRENSGLQWQTSYSESCKTKPFVPNERREMDNYCPSHPGDDGLCI